MTSLIDKKDLSNLSKDITYKVRKIAPISLIKPNNQTIIKKKITTLKSSYINDSKKLVTNTNNSKNTSSSRIVNSKQNSKNKSKLNNSFNPPSFINKLSNQTKRISSSTNKNLFSKKKNGINFACYSHKSSNQNSLNKEKNKTDNKLKNNSNNHYKQNSKRQNSLSCTKNLFFKSSEKSLDNDNKKILVKSRENSVHHLSIFPLISNNIQLKINSNSYKNSFRNENSIIIHNSIKNNINFINNNNHINNINNDTHIRNNSNNINNDTHIRNNSNNINNDTHIRNNSNNINNNCIKKETSVSKKVSISILRERQNFIKKKKMYKSFLNQKKQITLNVNLNKKFLEKEKEKNNKLKNQNKLTNRIIVHTEIEKEQEKLLKNTLKRNLLNLNNLPKDTNKYLRTYSNSLSKEIFDESSIDNIDNVLNSNEYFEFEHKDYEITEKDINSIIKKINFDEIRVNAKSIFSYKYNKEHEFYTSKFTKNFEQNIINNNSYYTLSTASSNLTKRTKENSSSKSLVYCNMIMKK